MKTDTYPTWEWWTPLSHSQCLLQTLQVAPYMPQFTFFSFSEAIVLQSRTTSPNVKSLEPDGKSVVYPKICAFCCILYNLKKLSVAQKIVIVKYPDL